MTHPTRQRLLQFIREAGECTLAELRERSGLSRSTLRRHLSLMAHDGVVEVHYAHRHTGRPPLLYRLTLKGELVTPATYAALLHDVSTVMEAQGRDQAKTRLHQIAGDPATPYPEIRRLPDLRARIDAARRLLFGVSETTEVQLTDGGYRFSLHTCPLAQRSMEFRDPCCVARTALQELIGQEVEQSEWIIRGDPRCTFEVKVAEKAPRPSSSCPPVD